MSQTNPETSNSTYFTEILRYFLRPLRLVKSYKKEYLSADLMAGLTVGFVMLPQAIAYALIAGLPAQTGLYSAIVGSIVGVLWGSSWHLQTGPSNAVSLLVLSTLSAIPAIANGSVAEYVAAAALLAVMVGIVRLIMGLAHLGNLVNFVSDSVVMGFTIGAGILIGVGQIQHLLRLDLDKNIHFITRIIQLFSRSATTHLPTLLLGLFTIVVILILKKITPKLPATLLSIVISSIIVWALSLHEQGVATLGVLPRSLPPFKMPPFDYDLFSDLVSGAIAISLIGLVEVTSISRSIASRSGQHLDANQEFIGQGLSNIATGFFSGYASSGSFTRSAINYESGAKTPLAIIVSAIFVMIMMLLFAPLALYLPRAALAGVIMYAAYHMVDPADIKRILNTSKGDSKIMVATVLATLLLPLKFAVLSGIIVSLIIYLNRTSQPAVHEVTPDKDFIHLIHGDNPQICPQLSILEIKGSLYFGATQYVIDEIRAHHERYPEQKLLLLRMNRVNIMDLSGLNAMESIVRLYREHGGDVYISEIRGEVWRVMKGGGFVEFLGRDHFVSKERAIAHIFYQVMDPAVCIYNCPHRVWRECQTLPKSDAHYDPIPIKNGVEHVMLTPETLWQEMQDQAVPLIVDVRDPNEFKEGHIEDAVLLPLPQLLKDPSLVPVRSNIVLTCRTNRRSMMAATAIQKHLGRKVRVLKGGMLAWEAANLPEVIN